MTETTTADSKAHGVGLTDAAAQKVRALLEQEGRDDLRLRIAVQPGGCSGLIYQLYFDERVMDGDAIVDFGGVGVAVDKMSVPYLDGATIDFEDTIQKQGFTIDNPNVWYELGVRHALRSRGVVLISGGKVPTAFDLYTDRKLRYHLKDGAPDPQHLASDITRLAEMAQATLASWHGRKISPVYRLVDNLQEPDWKQLKVGDAREFWERHAAWEQQVKAAQRSKRPGDVLVLAEETPVVALRANARLAAGEALLDVLEAAGIEVMHDCRRGECGLCAMDVLALDGRIDHRDVFLSEAEKNANRRICACVSRVVGRITLDTAWRPETVA